MSDYYKSLIDAVWKISGPPPGLHSGVYVEDKALKKTIDDIDEEMQIAFIKKMGRLMRSYLVSEAMPETQVIPMTKEMMDELIHILGMGFGNKSQDDSENDDSKTPEDIVSETMNKLFKKS